MHSKGIVMDRTTAADIDFLSHVSLFSALSGENLRKFAGVWTPVSRDVGQILFKKGEPSDAMYVLRSGKIAITVWTEDNQELLLTVLAEGDFFGELGLFDGSPRTASAKIIEKAEFLEIKRDDFLNFLRGNPDVCIALAGAIAQRLRTTNMLIEQRTTRNVNEEIEHVLTLGQRIADKVAQFGGSWGFVALFIGILAFWVAINTVEIFFHPIDPFPYSFLNLLLGLVSALQAPIIMMSQNRQSEKDRVRAELDYQVNLKSEMQIQSLHLKLDEIRAYEIQEMREVQRELISLLRKQEEFTTRILQEKG